MSTVDVIIPTYKPGKELFTLLDRLCEQTRLPGKIVIMNTEKDELEKLISTDELVTRYPLVELCNIAKKDFDHGKTRHEGVLRSAAEFFICMTQDAVPVDRDFIENLLAAFKDDDKLAAAYARQVPRSDCSPEELYARKFNYPVNSVRKTQKDLTKLGIKTYFCSNVAAMYRRSIYDELGGFIRKTIFNEDMIYAGGAIQKGYAVRYVPTAGVIHSHNYNCRQQFHRNFDIGVSQVEHPEVFKGLSNESEGLRMVSGTIRYLQDIHRPLRIPYYLMLVGSRYLGFKLGRAYKAIPRPLVRHMSLNKDYWN